MSIKSELDYLKTTDVYSILMFALFQCKKTNEYSVLSELSYLLDEKSLLNMCEYMGSMTITVPTIEEIELLLCGLSIYKKVKLDRLSFEETMKEYESHKFSQQSLTEAFVKIEEVMSTYSFGDTL